VLHHELFERDVRHLFTGEILCVLLALAVVVDAQLFDHAPALALQVVALQFAVCLVVLLAVLQSRRLIKSVTVNVAFVVRQGFGFLLFVAKV